MTTPRPTRHRLGAITLVVVVLGALLAVFPATAALGFLLLLIATVPAVVGYLLVRTGPAGHRRRALASLVLAPVFLVVAAVVTVVNAPPTPTTAVTAVSAPASGGRTSIVAPTSTPTPTSSAATVAPVTEVPVVQPLAAGATTAPAGARSTTAARSTRAVAPRPLVAVVAEPSTTKAAAKSTSPTKTPAPKKTPACDSSTHYVNDSGNCVRRPTGGPAAPGGASAKCKDGELSYSEHRRGTCSGHGGVAQWLAGAPSS